ncbi:hypothetical protein CF327_g5450 [Tilletia walkeri]|uniref:BAR domain-containing protein n=2 Tax=Tilletia TaxID=13289 RepID=A0A8X7T557_9BASI|nr:hypothetical protein CF327_g5450 [Tilletia walkeri]KAE8229324.1 hypothetical protein CF326_g5708 [Tilletia indica]KAE8250493.1 hypothetical protein A4X13_0g4680 [Tilletia indica]KAE8268023.1 hypothetical protein A4X09_0g4316 [Tilletia walkeri]
MEGFSFNKIMAQASPIGERLSRGFTSFSQSTRERLGQVDADEITELPAEYKDLETRVDALKAAHTALLRIARTYEVETYDYPFNAGEQVSQLGQQIGHSVTSWAATATKGNNNLPNVQPSAPPADLPKTLAHALSRAAASGAISLGASPTNLPTSPTSSSAPAPTSTALAPSKLGEALQTLAIAEDSVGRARLVQDDAIVDGFVEPFATFGVQIQLAIKARQNVRDARLHLDSWKQALKAAENAGKADKVSASTQAVEEAEDKLVAVTEECISLMKAVLESAGPVLALSKMVKAQAEYHKQAAEALSKAADAITKTASSAEAGERASRA